MKYIPKQKQTESETLYCFSPPVMIATMVIEMGLAIYIAWRYKWSRLTQLGVVTLVLLAVFQLAEYNICGNSILSLDWSRLGFVAISFLPPLGLHMITVITKRQRTKIILTSYGLATLFALFFAFFPNAVFHDICGGNYIIFHLDKMASYLYGLYYYGILIGVIALGMYEYTRKKTKPVRQTLRWHILGMLIFLVPTTIVNTLDPSTLTGIPSIMCGFAVLWALILGLVIIPANVKKRTT